MNGKKKIILISILIPLVLITTLIVVIYVGLNNYHDRNTWAVVSIEEVSSEETTDKIVPSKDLLKGDTVSLDDVTLEVTNVEHDGTISFRVKNGTLSDESGNQINKMNVKKDEKFCVRTERTSYVIYVENNYYA